MIALLDAFSVVFLKVAINENVKIRDHMSKIRFQDCSKLAINWKPNNYVIIYRHEIIVNFSYQV